MKLATIVGARPQFIKAKPVSCAIAKYNQLHSSEGERIAEIFIHTGQHYDYEMSQVFFETLTLRNPDYHLGVGSGSHGRQTAEILRKTEDVLEHEKPDAVVVFGDTNSTLAGSLAAAKLRIPIGHVESGLRSFNRDIPEEINRIVTDHVSTLLFAPTESAVRNLLSEGITRGVHMVGDVMYELALQYSGVAQETSKILERLNLVPKTYSLATVHRAGNTDDPNRLRGIVEALIEISTQCPIIWPVHPRTRERLRGCGLDGTSGEGLQLIKPLSYIDMLCLETSASVVLTDSGGVQKEAYWLQVPCVTLREETEWVETVDEGWNQLAGSNKESIVRAFARAMRGSISGGSSSANGHGQDAAAQIVRILAEMISDSN